MRGESIYPDGIRIGRAKTRLRKAYVAAQRFGLPGLRDRARQSVATAASARPERCIITKPTAPGLSRAASAIPPSRPASLTVRLQTHPRGDDGEPFLQIDEQIKDPDPPTNLE